MKWTANLDSVTKDGGNVVAMVTFSSDSGETRTERVMGDTLDAEALADWCARRIASFDARDAAYASLAVGPITLRLKAPQPVV